MIKIYSFDDKAEQAPHKKVPLTTLTNVHAVNEPLEGCQWHFGFVIQTQEGPIQFQCSTQREQDNWVKMVSLLYFMRKQGVSVNEINPFVFMREKLA